MLHTDQSGIHAETCDEASALASVVSGADVLSDEVTVVLHESIKQCTVDISAELITAKPTGKEVIMLTCVKGYDAMSCSPSEDGMWHEGNSRTHPVLQIDGLSMSISLDDTFVGHYMSCANVGLSYGEV